MRLRDLLALVLFMFFAIAVALRNGLLFRGYMAKDQSRAVLITDHEVQVIWTTGKSPIQVHVREFDYMIVPCLGMTYPILWALDKLRKRHKSASMVAGFAIVMPRSSPSNSGNNAT